jgi:hypothetical protein
VKTRRSFASIDMRQRMRPETTPVVRGVEDFPAAG